MFRLNQWLEKLSATTRIITQGYEQIHKKSSEKVLSYIIRKVKEEAINTISHNIQFIDELDASNDLDTQYEDGIFMLPVDSFDNYKSCIPYFSSTLISVYNNNIEGAIITFPALATQIIFNNNRVSYNTMSTQGYQPQYLDPGNLNAIDIFINKQYLKYLTPNTLITRNSQSILLMLLLNKISNGIITEQKHAILNRVITTILRYSEIPFQRKSNTDAPQYLIAGKFNEAQTIKPHS